jgi:hypothetical protein
MNWWYLQENNGKRTRGQNAKCRFYRRTNFIRARHSVTNNNGLLSSSRVRFHGQLYMRKNIQCLCTDVFPFRHRINKLYADTSINYPINFSGMHPVVLTAISNTPLPHKHSPIPCTNSKLFILLSLT